MATRPLHGMLIRVGADQSVEGGNWNAPAWSSSNDYIYVPIPESETRKFRHGLERPYKEVAAHLATKHVSLPPHLENRSMHLDPDFEYLTYGDQGNRASQIATLQPGDFVAFYGSFRDHNVPRGRLRYALFGIFFIDAIVRAADVEQARWHENAHTRRTLVEQGSDIVVRADTARSGRFEALIPIGEYRDGAYRVTRSLLTAWSGLSVNDGWLQRSARLPSFNNGDRFLAWLNSIRPVLHSNNWKS